jgi:hypothetical protein
VVVFQVLKKTAESDEHEVLIDVSGKQNMLF